MKEQLTVIEAFSEIFFVNKHIVVEFAKSYLELVKNVKMRHLKYPSILHY